jgi:hypothetical protein
MPLLLEGFLEQVKSLGSHAMQLYEFSGRRARPLSKFAVSGRGQRASCWCSDVPGKTRLRWRHALDRIRCQSISVAMAVLRGDAPVATTRRPDLPLAVCPRTWLAGRGQGC